MEATILAVIALSAVVSLSNVTEIVPGNYKRLYNGSVIISDHLAYVYRAPLYRVHEVVTASQPVTVQPLVRVWQLLDLLTNKVHRQCTQQVQKAANQSRIFRTGAQLWDEAYKGESPKESQVRSQEGTYILFPTLTPQTRYTPLQVAALCQSLGYVLPEPVTGETRAELQTFMISSGIERVLTSAKYDLATGLVSFPHSGTLLFEAFDSVYAINQNGEARRVRGTFDDTDGVFTFSKDAKIFFEVYFGVNHPNDDRYQGISKIRILEAWRNYPLLCQFNNSRMAHRVQMDVHLEKALVKQDRKTYRALQTVCQNNQISLQQLSGSLRDTLKRSLDQLGLGIQLTPLTDLTNKNVREKRGIIRTMIGLTTLGTTLFKLGSLVYNARNKYDENKRLKEMRTEMLRNAVDLPRIETFQATLEDLQMFQSTLTSLHTRFTYAQDLTAFLALNQELVNTVLVDSIILTNEAMALSQLIQDVQAIRAPNIMTRAGRKLTEMGRNRTSSLESTFF